MKLTVFLTAVLCAACHPEMSPMVPKTPRQRQMVALLEKFDRWDYNGDGELSEEEIRIEIRGLKGKPQQVPYTSKAVIDFYDTNKNGKISLPEAQDAYRRSHQDREVTGS